MEITKKIIVIGSDHAGFKLKQIVKQYLLEKNIYEIIDVGTNSTESTDYPDNAENLAVEVLKDSSRKGIIICGSGIGVSIVVNKFPGIRCALVHDFTGARLCRQHNDCNVIAMGEGFVGPTVAKEIVDAFLSYQLNIEERFQRRVNLIASIEAKLGTKLTVNLKDQENSNI